MLEKLVASLLVPYLSKYVEDIDEQQLSISLWNGKASLHDLILKPSVLNDLLNPPEDENHNNGPQLPISVHRGLCKNVSLTIPYNKLYSQPVVMEIGEVLLTVCGGTSSASTMSKSAKWDHTASEKEKKLDSFELERKKLRALKEAKEKEEEEASKATGQKVWPHFSVRGNCD
ncbi:N-terminal region of Chorein or VPS13, putative [Angomonas deanei]|uniref:N-terminal region of Chorein or VPS13, putative n=1 Tax=Angomonas deanei TaxID=59799 RepID=A0A7G2C1X0_9TRYP|nr:N-terminal region of Chorein or VPS13, putative [Angomonas deanei]